MDAAVESVCTLGGLDGLVSGKTRVLLKVNLLMKAAPDEAVTTHPAVVAGTIKALKKRGVRNIVIADSPSGYFSENRLKAIYERCGMTALTGAGVSLNYDTTAHTVSGQGSFRQFEVADVFTNADVVIGIGKAKTHAMTGMTGAVKNFFGVVAGLSKAKMHSRLPNKANFCEMLCALYDLIDPAFQIVDGVVGMEGNGPSGGKPRNFGFVLGGRNGYAVDRVLCEAIGMGPARALTVAASIARGSAPADLADIELAGDRAFVDAPVTDLLLPESAAADFTSKLPVFLRETGERVVRTVSPRPVIRTADCVGCAMCIEICPRQTITIKNKKAIINPADCIKCFCCHEVCPERAIDIKTSLLLRLMK